MKIPAKCPICATYVDTDCVVYTGPALGVLSATPPMSLTDALKGINTSFTNLDSVTEKIANKTNDIFSNRFSGVKYPSTSAVFHWVSNNYQPLLGFIPENVANKSTSTSLGTSNTLYPTQNAVKTYVDSSISAISIPTLQQVLDSGNSANDQNILLRRVTPIPISEIELDVNVGKVKVENLLLGYKIETSSIGQEFISSTRTTTVTTQASQTSGTNTVRLPEVNGTLAISVNGNTANANGNITIPYPNRVYVAVISMVDGSIINLLKNTLGDTLTWVASSGVIATSSSVLASENNTFVSVTSGSAVPKIVSADVAVSSLSWNVSIYQTDNAGAPNNTGSVFVEIRVY